MCTTNNVKWSFANVSMKKLNDCNPSKLKSLKTRNLHCHPSPSYSLLTLCTQNKHWIHLKHAIRRVLINAPFQSMNSSLQNWILEAEISVHHYNTNHSDKALFIQPKDRVSLDDFSVNFQWSQVLENSVRIIQTNWTLMSNKTRCASKSAGVKVLNRIVWE